MTKNSVCHAPYLRNHTPYDCHLQYLQYTSVKRQKLVQNPVFFLGEGRDGGHTSVSTSIAKKKIVVQLGSLEALQNLTSGVHRQSFRISWLFCILNSSKNRSHGSTTIKVTKAYTRNQQFLIVWGLSLRSQTNIPATKQFQIKQCHMISIYSTHV